MKKPWWLGTKNPDATFYNNDMVKYIYHDHLFIKTVMVYVLNMSYNSKKATWICLNVDFVIYITSVVVDYNFK